MDVSSRPIMFFCYMILVPFVLNECWTCLLTHFKALWLSVPSTWGSVWLRINKKFHHRRHKVAVCNINTCIWDIQLEVIRSDIWSFQICISEANILGIKMIYHIKIRSHLQILEFEIMPARVSMLAKHNYNAMIWNKEFNTVFVQIQTPA